MDNDTPNSILFEALSAAQANDLRSRSTPVHYPARRAIFGIGEPGETMLLIDTGRVEISVTSGSGRRSILAQLGRNDVVGEMAVLDGEPRSADAVAATDVTGRILTRAHVMAFLRDDPSAAILVIGALCERLRLTNESLANHVLTDGRTRLARLLLRLAETWGKPDQDGALRLDHGFSQSDLGDMSGLTRETVNRQIKRWEKDGVLRRDDDGMLITDKSALEAMADADAR